MLIKIFPVEMEVVGGWGLGVKGKGWWRGEKRGKSGGRRGKMRGVGERC